LTLRHRSLRLSYSNSLAPLAKLSVSAHVEPQLSYLYTSYAGIRLSRNEHCIIFFLLQTSTLVAAAQAMHEGREGFSVICQVGQPRDIVLNL